MTLSQIIDAIISDELASGNVVSRKEVYPYASNLYAEVQAMLSKGA